jgi:hypothetical protein
MKKAALLLCAFVFISQNVRAFDIELFPENADRNSFFFNVKAVSVSFTEGFVLTGQEFGFDWVIPVLIPLSLGAWLAIPEPNLKSFGARAAYHINIESEKLDLYGMYVFDFGFLRNGILLEYGDEEQPVRYYDFRVGLRYLFNMFCLAVETDFKLQGINIGKRICRRGALPAAPQHAGKHAAY